MLWLSSEAFAKCKEVAERPISLLVALHGWKQKSESEGLPGGSVVKNLPVKGDKCSIPGPGGSHMLWSN